MKSRDLCWTIQSGRGRQRERLGREEERGELARAERPPLSLPLSPSLSSLSVSILSFFLPLFVSLSPLYERTSPSTAASMFSTATKSRWISRDFARSSRLPEPARISRVARAHAKPPRARSICYGERCGHVGAGPGCGQGGNGEGLRRAADVEDRRVHGHEEPGVLGEEGHLRQYDV